MTLTYEEIKEVGLAVSLAVAGEAQDAIPAVLANLSHDELVALVTAVTEVYITSASKAVKFRTWMSDVVEDAVEVGPDSNIIPVLIAIALAAELTLG